MNIQKILFQYIFLILLIISEILSILIDKNINVNNILFFIIIMGGAMNLLAVSFNGKRMPVLVNEYNYNKIDTDKHFFIDKRDKEKIKLFEFIDKYQIRIKCKKKVHIINYSIGDIFLCIGIICYIPLIIINLFL